MGRGLCKPTPEMTQGGIFLLYYIKVVNPRLTAEVVPGDIVQAGIIISNSETGLGAVCIQPLIYRLVCSNGVQCLDIFREKEK